MEDNKKDLGSEVANATKWSLATQIASKLISPVTTLILAHLLAPEAFGVIALVAMVTSFAEMFSDAGFQKYLIQHEYESSDEFSLSANAAFWTNGFISVVLWVLVVIFRNQLAALVGNPDLGFTLACACASLPLVAASSVQIAIYQRSFDFKTLFSSRTVSALLILTVSVGCALMGFGYWSMIFGTLASNLFLAVWLTIKSTWKPRLLYSFSMLHQMFSFSFWTLLEAISIWITAWMGTFVLATIMNDYYLGLYNTSISLANAVTGIATSAVNPIIFASLSRFQNNRERFDSAFYLMQRYLAFVCVPLAVCMFVYRDMIVALYLGENWIETADFFGLYAAANAFIIVFGHIASESYRSLGKPRISIIVQLIAILFILPAQIYGALAGFFELSYLVPIARLIGSLVGTFLTCRLVMGLSPIRMMLNLRYVYLISAIDMAISLVLVNSFPRAYLLQLSFLALSVGLFFVLAYAFKDTREIMLDMANRFNLRRVRKAN